MAQHIANDQDFLSCMFKRDMTVCAWYVNVPPQSMDSNMDLDMDMEDIDLFLWEIEGNGPR